MLCNFSFLFELSKCDIGLDRSISFVNETKCLLTLLIINFNIRCFSIFCSKFLMNENEYLNKNETWKIANTYFALSLSFCFYNANSFYKICPFAECRSS